MAQGDLKAPFSIANMRCREGHYSFPWIAPFYSWYIPYKSRVLSKVPFFEPLVWFNLGLNSSLPGHWQSYALLNVVRPSLVEYKWCLLSCRVELLWKVIPKRCHQLEVLNPSISEKNVQHLPDNVRSHIARRIPEEISA